jgi:hypothetical protein
MGDRALSASTSSLVNQPMRSLCEGGCGRRPTKASGRRWCFWCDPSVSEETKLSARQLGGRRGILGPSEALALLEGDLGTSEGRGLVRARLMQARASGQLGTGMYRDLLAGLDGAAKDQERKVLAKPSPIIVEVQKYGPNGREGHS